MGAFAQLATDPVALMLVTQPLTGFIALQLAGPDCDLTMVAVDPAFRRGGTGRVLVAAGLAAAAARGVESVFLEVAETNQAARALYRACGFEPVGRRAGYYPPLADDPGHALVLRRDVAPAGL